MELSRPEGKKKHRSVPIDTVRMDKPVYAVPLQTTMSINFVLSKDHSPECLDGTALTNPLQRHQESHYHSSPPSYNSQQASFEHENGDSSHGRRDSGASSEATSAQEALLSEEMTDLHLNGSHSKVGGIGADSIGRASGKKSGKMYVVELNDVDEGARKHEEGDSDGELDVGKLEARSNKHKSTFNHMTWRLPSAKKFTVVPSAIIVYCDSEIVVMLKVACSKETTLKCEKLQALMVDVVENCANRLKQMMKLSLPKLCPRHMDSLPLSDQRPTRTHLEALSKQLDDQINLSDVAYRYQTEDIYIGTYVSNKVKSSRQWSIGDTGVIAVLSRKSKYATIDAFSEQLCQHIAVFKPASLGYVSDVDVRKINKRGTLKIQHLQKDQLLLQNFYSDPTIIVAEAARKSFVKIEDFLLFY